MKKMFLSMIVLVLALMFQAHAAVDNSAIVSVSMINQNPDPASAAGVVEVRFGVENKGGVSAENYVLELMEQYPFTVVSGENSAVTIGYLSPYQTGDNEEIVKFQIAVDKDASAGTYPLKIKVYQAGKESAAAISAFNISVGSSATAESIWIDKTSLTPGTIENVTFTITNTGNAPLKDLTFTWENSDSVILPVGSDNRNYVKYVGVGQSVSLPYRMMANSGATAGLYQLDLTLSYFDYLDNKEKTISSSAGMYVGGGTDFDIAFSESSSGEIAFTVSNIGSNPATSVSVIVPQQSVWSVTGSNSAIVGNLNSGDYTVVSFTLSQSTGTASGAPISPGSRNMTMRSTNQSIQGGKLKLQIQYTDTSGMRKTVEKEVAISISSSTASTSTSSTASSYSNFGNGIRRNQQSFFSKYKYYILAFAALVVCVALGFYRHKYKKEKLVNPSYRVKDLFFKKKEIILKKK
jgi:hypothetical protein